MMKVTGTDAWLKQFKTDAKKAIETPAIEAMREAALLSIKVFQSYTPVWSGATVRNYRVGIDGAAVGPMTPPVFKNPGPTSTMPLGPEPNRAANQALAIADAERMLSTYKDLSKPLFINNTVVSTTGDGDKFALIDAGLAPEAPGRNAPGGVMKPGLQVIKAALKGKFE